LTGNVTITNDLLVSGTFTGLNEGQTFTGDVRINDNSTLYFEGVATDMDGLTVNCDNAGDTTISCTAGQIEVSTKDGVVKFVDTDAVTDYITLTTVAASGRQVIAAEPSGLFRFKDAGDANNSDVLDLDLTDAGAANKLTSAVAFEIETTAGAIVLDSATDITLDPAGNDVIFGVSAGKFTLAATSTTLYGGDTGGDDLVLTGNSSDADPVFSLLGGGGMTATVLDQAFKILYDGSNYLNVAVSSSGDVVMSAVGATDSIEIVSNDGSITLTAATDIVLAAAGNDVTMDAQLTITETTADQLLVRYDASNHFGVDVDVDGSTTLTTTGTNADFEIASGTAGDITLDATAAIIFEPATTATFTLAAAGGVVFDAATTDHTGATVISMDMDVNSASSIGISLDVDVGTALSAAEIVSGIKVDIDGDGGDDAGAYMNAILLTSANTSTGVNTGINIGGTWDNSILVTLAATGNALEIDAGTTDHTGATIITANLDVNSASCTLINATIDVGTALSAAEIVKGIYFDMNTLATDANTSGLYGVDLLMTAITTSAADIVGYKVTLDGTSDTGDYVWGVGVDANLTLNNASELFYGVVVDTAGVTDTQSSELVAYKSVLGASTEAINIDAGTTDHTAGNIITADVDVNSATVNFIYADINVGTALSTGETVTGLNIDIDGDGADHADSVLNGIYLTSANTSTSTNNSAINVAGTWDTVAKLLVGAATTCIDIDAGTTDHTGASIITANLDVNSASCTLFNATIDVGTALSAAEIVKGIYFDMNELAACANTSALYGVDLLMTGIAAAQADLVGYKVTFDGTKSGSDTTYGLLVDANLILNQAAEVFNGIRIDTAGVTDTSSGELVGVKFVLGASTEALNIDAGTTDHTAGNIITADVDVNSASVNFISADIDVGTALSAAETVNGVYIDINGNAGDDGTALMNAISITSANTTAGINTGIYAAGTWDIGIDLSDATTTTDIELSNGALIHNTSASVLTITEATVAIVGNITVSGHRDSHIMMYNNFNQGVTGTASTLDDGTAFIDQAQTATTIVYPISALKVGDELVGFRIVGALGATGGNATTVDADLRKVTKGAGTVTDASVGAITQTSVTADTALDTAKTFGAVETVASDYQYYVLVTVTTANNAANDVALTGVELDINRKV